jgi:hypothetical protein
MAKDDPALSALDRAIKERKELQDVIKTAMQKLEKIEQFLSMFRHYAAADGSTDREIVGPTINRGGHGKSQQMFEMLARTVMLDLKRPVRSPEIVEEFRKRGHPIGGVNEIKTAWNRLWSGKASGVFLHVPHHGYWPVDEPLDVAGLPPRPKKPHGAPLNPNRGTPKGRPKKLNPEQVAIAEEMLLAGKSGAEVGKIFGGLPPATIYSYFPGGVVALRRRQAEEDAKLRAELDKMTLDLASVEHARLEREISKHDRLYYQEDNPQISNKEYDMMRRRYGALEERFPAFRTLRHIIDGAEIQMKKKKS